MAVFFVRLNVTEIFRIGPHDGLFWHKENLTFSGVPWTRNECIIGRSSLYDHPHILPSEYLTDVTVA